MELLTSDDNVNFVSRGSTATAVREGSYRYRMDIAGLNASGRYIRFRANSSTSTIFASELEIFPRYFEIVDLGANVGERLMHLIDPSGRRTTYGYDSAGRLTSVVDKLGNSAGQDPNAHKWQYGYDGPGRHIATLTDPDGRLRTTNTYDSYGRLLTQKDGLNNQTGYAYSAAQTVLTDPRGHASTPSFDAQGRIISQVDVVGANTYTASYSYDGYGNRSSVTDRRGNRTDFTHDSRGNLTERREAQLDPQTPRFTTLYQYDAKNNLTQLTDATGAITTHSYDPTTNVLLSSTSQIDASTVATTKYEYGDTLNPGLVTRIVAPRGNTAGTPDYSYSVFLAYDNQGNLSEKLDADGAQYSYGYDSLGRRTSTIDPDGFAPGGVPSEHTWTTTYDANDQVTADTNPLGQSAGYTYDGAGNRATATDRRGNVTTYVYDAAARLWKVRQQPDPVGQPTLVYETVVTRDQNGNATAVTQANGAVTDYGYDALDRLTSTTVHPATGVNLVTSLALDGNGNVTTRTTADNVATSYSYDNLSRLLSISAAGLSTISYQYDELSRRTSMTDGTGVTTYSYDRLSRLTSVTQPNGGVGYGYDLDSDRTSLSYPGVGGGTVTYVFSPGGRLNSLTDWASRTSTYTYTAAGLAKTVSVPGGLTTTYAYDRAQRLMSLVNAVSSTTITSHAYTLDAEGNRTALAEFVSGISAPGTTDAFGFGYDGLNRLSAVTTTNPESFTLDAASNITARSGPSASYTVDGENRPTSDGTNTLVWSDADRLTSRGSDTFGYDPLDRLTSSIVAGTTRTYAYSGDGLLQSRTQATVTSLLWDPSTALARLLQQGGDRIIYGLGPLYVARDDGTTRAPARDGGKSVRAEVDGTGSVTGSWRYRAYGETSQSSGQSTPTILGYAGQLLDPSALYYMRARWYDAASGRFMSRDLFDGLAAAPRTLNAFGYGGANPALMTDPSGLVFSSGSDEGGACPDVHTCLADEADVDDGQGSLKDGYVGCGEVLWCHVVDDRKTLADLLAERRIIRAAPMPGGWSFFADDVGENESADAPGGPGAGGPGLLGALRRAFNKDQRALIELAKAAKRSGVTSEEAETLVAWAEEYGVYNRGPERHLRRSFKDWHIQIDVQRHIRIIDK